MSYLKEVFHPTSLEHAKAVVLTPDPSNPNKFKEETDFIINVMRPSAYMSKESKVLDFGCGMGRVSKALIEEYDCEVIGVDFSADMLKHAVNYVNNPQKFKPMQMYDIPNSIDIAFCILVLQHVEDPQTEIDRLYEVIKPNGYLVLVDEKQRLVPSGVDSDNYVIWSDDKFDVEAAIWKKFKRLEYVKYMSHPRVQLELFQKSSENTHVFSYQT